VRGSSLTIFSPTPKKHRRTHSIEQFYGIVQWIHVTRPKRNPAEVLPLRISGRGRASAGLRFASGLAAGKCWKLHILTICFNLDHTILAMAEFVRSNRSLRFVGAWLQQNLQSMGFFNVWLKNAQKPPTKNILKTWVCKMFLLCCNVENFQRENFQRLDPWYLWYCSPTLKVHHPPLKAHRPH